MKVLTEIRKSKGLTLEAIAIAAQTSPVSISRYETGARKPSVKMAKKLGPIYGIPWTDFFADDDGKAAG